MLLSCDWICNTVCNQLSLSAKCDFNSTFRNLCEIWLWLHLGTATVVLADVVDYGEYKFGSRNESITFSIQTLMVKFTSAMGALLTGAALTWTGYVPNAVQTETTLMGIRIVMIVIPTTFAIASFVIYKGMFKLNGEYYDRIMNILALRKNELEEYLKKK